LKVKAQRQLQSYFTLESKDTPHPQVAKSFRRNFLVNGLDLIFWHFGDSFVSVDTILPVFVSTITTSPVVIGMVRAIWNAGWFMPQLFLAPSVEKKSRQLPTVLVLGALERLPYLVLGFAILWLPSLDPGAAVAFFMALYVWKSFAAGMVALPWQEMIAKVIPVSRRGRFIGYANLVGRAMGVLGGIVAGVVLKRYAYPQNYAVLFFIAFVVITISWGFLAMNKEPEIKKEPTGLEKQPPYLERLKGIMRSNSNFRKYLISRGLCYIGNMAYGFVAVYAIQRFNLPDTYAAVFTVILFGGGIIGFAIWGGLGDRLGHKRVLVLSTLVWIMGLLLLGFTSSLTWIYIIFGLMSIASTGNMVGDFNIAMEFGPESERPTYIGLARTLTGPILLLAPIAAGLIVKGWGYTAMFNVSLVFVIAGFVLLTLNVEDPRKLSPEVPPL